MTSSTFHRLSSHRPLQQELEQFVQEDSDVVGAMTMANYDGIEKVYLTFELEDELNGPDNEIFIDTEGHIGLGVDIERPLLRPQGQRRSDHNYGAVFIIDL